MQGEVFKKKGAKMKKLLIVILLFVFSTSIFANNYGLQNTEDRLRITVTGEVNGSTSYNWQIYNSDEIVSSGSNVMNVPNYVTNQERYIAEQLSNTTLDGWYIVVITSDEEED